jgi:hypothetical protein
MKRGFAAILGLMVIWACSNEKEIVDSDLTGKQLLYPLYKSSAFDVSGSVAIQQKKDGSARIVVNLKGLTGNDIQFPVHLHFGGNDLPDAELAAQLNPVDVATGKSVTDIYLLTNEAPITYQDFAQFAGSIKIHLAETGEGRKIILASGNIGKLYSSSTIPQNQPIAICKGGS